MNSDLIKEEQKKMVRLNASTNLWDGIVWPVEMNPVRLHESDVKCYRVSFRMRIECKCA